MSRLTIQTFISIFLCSILLWLPSYTIALAPLTINSTDAFQNWTTTFDGLRSTGSSRIYGTSIDPNDGTIVVAGEASSNFLGRVDDNRDGLVAKLHPDNGDVIWVRWFSTPQPDTAFGTCIDAAGNIFVVGFTEGSMNGQLHYGGHDIFLSKLTADGDIIFTRQYGSTQTDFPGNCVTDIFGNVYISGQTNGNLFGAPYPQYVNTVFLAQINQTNGNVVWGRHVSGRISSYYGTQHLFDTSSGWPYATSRGLSIINPIVNITTTPKLILSFYTDREDLVRDFPASGEIGSYAGVVGQYHAVNGSAIWNHYYRLTDVQKISAATDAAGNIFVSGATASSLYEQPYSGGVDIFVSKLSFYGEHRWTRLQGTADRQEPMNIAVDDAGGVYVVGFTHIFPGTIRMLDNIYATPYSRLFGSSSTSYPIQLGFVSKWDIEGNRLWTELFSPYMPSGQASDLPPWVTSTSIVIDKTTNKVYISGHKTGVWVSDAYPTTASLSAIASLQAVVMAVHQRNDVNCTIAEFEELLRQINNMLARA